LLAAAALGCGPDSSAADSADGERLELHVCARSNIADAKCGIWSVEENRAAPNGRSVTLTIFVAPATSRSPAADPV